MLSDAHRYMDVLNEVDRAITAMETAIFEPNTPDALAHDLRVRRKQLTDVRALITGDAHTLPRL